MVRLAHDPIARMHAEPSAVRCEWLYCCRRVTLVEASELLGNFDGKLREYAAQSLVKAGVHLMKGLVKEVRETSMTLADGQVMADVCSSCLLRLAMELGALLLSCTLAASISTDTL